ncbi:MAG: MlaD family protein [Myxococcales bacterium]|nr:MlaD family protein [Polyangiaceae bacterium]MDW8250340.1 MlaD family protein [Myxococcales bacterium]
MSEVTRNAKVAVFALVLTGAMGGLWNYFGKGQRFGPKGIRLYLTMKDATGLAPMGRVHMAGIAIGSIKEIGLSKDGRARIQIQINPGVVLYKDAAVAKQTATLLSEPFLAVSPGATGQPELQDGDEIVNVIEPRGMDQILNTVGEISDNVNKVTKSMAASLGTDDGKEQMKAILRNIEQATAQLAWIAAENRQSLRTTFRNLEDISTMAKPRAAKILGNVESTTTKIDRIVEENREDIRGITRGARESVDKFQRSATPLESALQHIDRITGRIDRGEGTVGRLTKDEALIDEIQGAAEGLNDVVGGISRLQTIVSLRSDYNFLANSVKTFSELRLQPREDKYYMIELINDPRGRTTVEQIDVDTTNPNQPAHYREVRTTTVNQLRVSVMIARRLGSFTGLFGVRESTGGVGLYWHGLDDRVEVRNDLFGFTEQITPRWRLGLSYEFIRRLWLQGGVDNLLVPDRRDYFTGLNLRFNDDDLKSFLLFVPSP